MNSAYPNTKKSVVASSSGPKLPQAPLPPKMGTNAVSTAGSELAKDLDPERVFGMTNTGGEQSCFLNSILQTFWNILPLRREFISFASKESADDHLFIREFKKFFCEVRANVEKTKFDSFPVRRELFKLFYLSNKYNLNDMSDANEALENILNLLHAHLVGVDIASEQDSDKLCKPVCFVHESFHIPLALSTMCPCGAQKTEKLDSNHFLQHVFPAQLLGIVNASVGEKGDSSKRRSTYAGVNLRAQMRTKSELFPHMERLPEYIK